MHQAGLHVPAEAGSRLPVFRDVFADIGDEQSIAQSLSTFSSHLRSITRIVEHAGPGTLVLLDELGAGTDPTEGSALAQALLDHFIRSGALVAATTHYAEIKVYAHETAAARNASVEFDLETLSPDLPADDRAARRLPGLCHRGTARHAGGDRGRRAQPPVREPASLRIDPGVHSHPGARDRRRPSIEPRSAEARAAEALRTADDERRRARRERDEAVKAAREEAQRLVDSLKDEVAGVRRRLERETVTAPAIDAALARAEQTLDRLPAAPAARERTAPVEPRTWQLGERARSRSGGWEGRIAALEKGGTRATLEAGGMRVSVAVSDLEAASGITGGDNGPATGPETEADAVRAATRAGGSRGRGTGISTLGLQRARSVASSLDLRGARVDEALEALGRYLDDASLAGLEQVIIIHGLGTGALRDAVRTQASSHPLVRDFRAGERGEGGDGATIVRLLDPRTGTKVLKDSTRVAARVVDVRQHLRRTCRTDPLHRGDRPCRPPAEDPRANPLHKWTWPRRMALHRR